MCQDRPSNAIARHFCWRLFYSKDRFYIKFIEISNHTTKLKKQKRVNISKRALSAIHRAKARMLQTLLRSMFLKLPFAIAAFCHFNLHSDNSQHRSHTFHKSTEFTVTFWINNGSLIFGLCPINICSNESFTNNYLSVSKPRHSKITSSFRKLSHCWVIGQKYVWFRCSSSVSPSAVIALFKISV